MVPDEIVRERARCAAVVLVVVGATGEMGANRLIANRIVLSRRPAGRTVAGERKRCCRILLRYAYRDERTSPGRMAQARDLIAVIRGTLAVDEHTRRRIDGWTDSIAAEITRKGLA